MLARLIHRLLGGEITGDASLRPYDQRKLVAIDGDNQAITLAAIIGGIVNRTGTTGNTADTLPTVDSVLAAIPDLSVGDAVAFSIRMANAHTNTLTTGTGMTLVGTTTIAASSIREYLLTLTSAPKRTRVCSASTTNGSKIITNISQTDLANIGVGMLASGTGIAASSLVTAVNLTASTVSVAVNMTATADNIAVTFTPQADLLGVGVAGI